MASIHKHHKQTSVSISSSIYTSKHPYQAKHGISSCKENLKKKQRKMEITLLRGAQGERGGVAALKSVVTGGQEVGSRTVGSTAVGRYVAGRSRRRDRGARVEVLRTVRRCGERGNRATVAGIKPTATETCGYGSLVGGEGVSGGRPVRGEERNWKRWRVKMSRGRVGMEACVRVL